LSTIRRAAQRLLRDLEGPVDEGRSPGPVMHSARLNWEVRGLDS
jgi:hypothetical protein